MNTNGYKVDQHLTDKEPVVAKTYEKLIGSLQRFGPVTESAKKGSIHLDNKKGFAGVYTRKNYILLHFRLDHQLESQRIQKVEQLSKSRFKHTIKLKSETDVDDELMSWLKDAYNLSG